MKRLRVGVVGVGYLGRFHSGKYAGMDDVELVGVADTDRGRAEDVAREFGCAAFGDYRLLLDKVDAASIVVPTPAHFEVSRAFLSHDIDVLIEKPITTRIEEADALIDLAGRRARLIQVGHLERFNPAVVALSDRIGSIGFIESHRLSPYGPRGTDVSVVLDLMIHDIDIILAFVQAPVREIRASGMTVVSSHVDIANARLEFANGCVANITASRLAARSERKMRLFQTDGYLAIDFGRRSATVIRPDPSGRSGDGPIPGMHVESRQWDAGDALKDEIQSFVSAVRRRGTPVVTGRMGRDALDVALGIMDQIQAHQRRIAVSAGTG